MRTPASAAATHQRAWRTDTTRWVQLRRLRVALSGSRGQQLVDMVLVAVTAAVFLGVGDAGLIFHVGFVALAANAFLFGRTSTTRRVLAMAIVIAAYGTIRLLQNHDAGLDLAEWPLMVLIALLTAEMADRRRAIAAHYEGLYEAAARALTHAQENERRRLSRELHDDIGQHLVALTLSLDAAGLKASGPDEAAAIEEARELAEEALERTRRLADDVRPVRFESGGLAPALERRARRLLPAARLEIVGHENSGRQLAPAQQLELFRCLQEALTNVALHASATAVCVELLDHPETFEARVVDDGVGFDASHVQGLGLTGLRERVELLGGACRISSQPGNGTEVVIVVPYHLPKAPGAVPA